ncbi:hypothetical protein ACQJBY_041244 [Aegilops geniculata]
MAASGELEMNADNSVHEAIGAIKGDGSLFDINLPSTWGYMPIPIMERRSDLAAALRVTSTPFSSVLDSIRSGLLRPIPPPKIISGVIYVSHQKRRHKHSRAFGRSISLCDQVIAQNYTPTPKWVFDTGASFSVTGNAANLRGIHDATPVNAVVANGQTMSSYHCGRAFGNVSVSGVRYFPGTPNLISCGHLARLGCCSTTSEHGLEITKDGMVVGYGSLSEDNTYSVDFLDDRFLGTICSSCPWPHGN